MKHNFRFSLQHHFPHHFMPTWSRLQDFLIWHNKLAPPKLLLPPSHNNLYGCSLLFQNDLPCCTCNIMNWSNLAFDYYLQPTKHLWAIVPPPYMQSSIQRHMKWLEGSILFVLIFCISLNIAQLKEKLLEAKQWFITHGL